MIQKFYPLAFEDANRILCYYANTTSFVQVARITNIPNFNFERVVFPGQRLLFEAVANAKLEIHTSMTDSDIGVTDSAIRADRITCKCLRVL